MAKLKEGDKAPDFNLPASDGSKVSLKKLRGSTVVLYFYPKDDTPGCTTEACGFRDQFPAFRKIKAVVLGLSPDSVASHEKFIGKFKLPFLLLSDEEKEVCKAYGVWVKKSMYGREYMGVARTTFVIGPDSRIHRIFEKVSPKGHEKEVLESIQELEESAA